MLIAAHPWDVDGARRAGLQAGWLNRSGRDYPGFFEAPDVSGETLGDLAEALLSG
jgi:2-haloacid dehalogenase